MWPLQALLAFLGDCDDNPLLEDVAGYVLTMCLPGAFQPSRAAQCIELLADLLGGLPRQPDAGAVPSTPTTPAAAAAARRA